MNFFFCNDGRQLKGRITVDPTINQANASPAQHASGSFVQLEVSKMKNKFSIVVVVLVLVFGLAGIARADVTFTAGFEGGTCFENANDFHYPRITFINAEALYLSQGCLNPSFPPHTGDGVIYDSGTPIQLILNEAEGTETGDGDTVSGYFTTSSDITIQAFDNGTLCGSTFFQGPNYVGSGGTPNAFLSVHCPEITSVSIFSSTGPNSFTLDDLTYPIADTPEPATVLLLGTGLAGVLRKRFRTS
jgi:hypothetical protein